MLIIREEQMEVLKKNTLLPIVFKMKTHLLYTFPDLKDEGKDEALVKHIETTIYEILKYDIDTEILAERFLELSVVYGWTLYEQQDVKEILEDKNLNGYLKIKRIERLLMEQENA